MHLTIHFRLIHLLISRSAHILEKKKLAPIYQTVDVWNWMHWNVIKCIVIQSLAVHIQKHRQWFDKNLKLLIQKVIVKGFNFATKMTLLPKVMTYTLRNLIKRMINVVLTVLRPSWLRTIFSNRFRTFKILKS